MKPDYLDGKQALLLDMNSTFMFGEDNFNADEDYSIRYKKLGGELPDSQVNQVIRQAYDYLDVRYPLAEYHDAFPSLPDAIKQTSNWKMSTSELAKLIETFALHERGYISTAYVDALQQLKQHYRLGLVVDIWSPKTVWVEYFKELEIVDYFEAISFSSDHGHVKPSAFGFTEVLNKMKLEPDDTLFIGDSVRRDLGGATAAGLDCVLVGEAQSELALDNYTDLLMLCQEWLN